MPQQSVVFFVAGYLDVAEAAGDFAAVERLYAESGFPEAFDGVIVGRKASGDPRIYQHAGFSGSRDDAGTGECERRCLSAGLLLSLAPDIGVGGALAESASEQLRVVAGQVTRATGRDGLRSLGEFLDSSNAALVLATTATMAEPARAALRFAGSTIEIAASL